MTTQPGARQDAQDAVSSTFADAAAKMPTTVRSLLVENADPCSISVDALLTDLGIKPERHLLTADDAKVVHAPSSLSAAACAALREAVDRSCGAKADSVDGLPDHQLPLTFDQLSSLIGGEEARALVALPAAHFANKCADAEERPSDIFVRRYAGGTRPWNPFHHDSAAVTVNVALCSDDSFVGGKLVAVCKGEVSTLSREEGEATIHDSRLLHAVTRITSGVRYSLICFIGQSADADAEGGAAGEREAFQAFLGGLTEEQRERVLEELERAEQPAASALQAQEAAVDRARARAPAVRAAVEEARAEEALAVGALREAEQAVQASRHRLDAALRAAQAAREACFGEQVAAQRLRVELAAVRAEARQRLMRHHDEARKFLGRGGGGSRREAGSRSAA